MKMQGSPAKGPAAAGGLAANLQGKLAELERYACDYYTAHDKQKRQAAQIRLQGFERSAEYLPHCQFILDNSKNEFAQMMAATSLFKLVTMFWNNYSSQQTVQMRDYVLNYIAKNCGNLSKHVLSKLIQVPCRVTKLGWNDTPPVHREITKHLTKFLSHSVTHCITGLRILKELVQDFNSHLKGQSITQHRRVAVSFRDSALLHIFQLAISTLTQVASKQVQCSPDQDAMMRTEALQLCHKCLSFDYIGISPDESSEDFCSLQIPSSWRGTIEDPKTLGLIINLLFNSKPDHASIAMEILVQLSSTRRSLFSTDEVRSNFLNSICEACVDILKNHPALLTNQTLYIHFCRLLVAVKSNYQLDDIARVKNYKEWIELVSKFTIKSFGAWEWAAKSVHYLVHLWARLTLSIPYMRGDVPTFLDSFVPQVANAFITTRIDAVKQALEQDELDELYDAGDLESQLRHLPTMCRFKYQAAYTHITGALDPLMHQYKQVVHSLQAGITPDKVKALNLIEAQLSWLIYVVGAVVSGNAPTGADREAQLKIDAHLCARVFQLLSVVDFRLNNQSPHAPCSPHLDLAILHFFQQFRRSHIAPSTLNSPGCCLRKRAGRKGKIYQMLAEHLGATDQAGILSHIIRKIVLDLRMWGGNAKVVQKALTLFNDLSAGYSSSKMLIKLEAARSILENHTADNFPFMKHPPNFKLRTTFYRTVGRILLNDQNIEYFDKFMAPFDQTFQQLSNQSDFRNDQIKHIGTGLCRDLRGLVSAIQNRKVYQMFFDWMYPRNFRVFLRLFETWWDTPQTVIPMLRFISDFVDQKSQRIVFPSSSPNGIILFKETSKVLETYGNRVLNAKQIELSDPYKERYKGVMLCMQILARSLNGGYVNFGVFELYRDKALSQAVNTVLKLVLSIRLEILLAYKKISQEYFSLLEVLFRNHVNLLVKADSKVLHTLIESLAEGIQHTDTNQSSIACKALDNLIEFIWENSKKRTPSEALVALKAHIAKNPDVLGSLLATLFNRVLFDNSKNQWAMSRPIFSLIVNCPQYYEKYKKDLASTQPQQHHQKLVQAFDAILMKDISPKIDDKNREVFTRNLVRFKNEMRGFISRPLGL